MKIVIAEDTGFCYGVQRAIGLVKRRLEAGKEELYSLGPLIHNRLVMKELEKKGLKIVDNPSRIKGSLIIRSHGLHPALIEEARRKKIRVIDTTCPFVKSVQKRVKYLVIMNYEVIIIGNPNHPEVGALAGFARDEAIIIDQKSNINPVFNTGQISKIGAKKVGVVSQTTINVKDYQRIISELYKKIGPEEFLVFNTICEITKKRQKEVAKLSRRVDSFLVLGSKESSNTRALYELCKKRRPAFLIETPSQIKEEWFKTAGTIGILSGTSTPDWVVKATADALARLKNE